MSPFSWTPRREACAKREPHTAITLFLPPQLHPSPSPRHCAATLTPHCVEHATPQKNSTLPDSAPPRPMLHYVTLSHSAQRPALRACSHGGYMLKQCARAICNVSLHPPAATRSLREARAPRGHNAFFAATTPPFSFAQSPAPPGSKSSRSNPPRRAAKTPPLPYTSTPLFNPHRAALFHRVPQHHLCRLPAPQSLQQRKQPHRHPHPATPRAPLSTA